MELNPPPLHLIKKSMISGGLEAPRIPSLPPTWTNSYMHPMINAFLQKKLCKSLYKSQHIKSQYIK